jgi:type IV pilus biogenesis protein CpaD/CtpE
MSFTSKALDQRLVLAVAAALALAGCAKKKEEPVAEAPAAEPAAAAETLEGQVDIVAWPGYI